ncbi:iron-responsive transcriptional regulator RirA [Deferribacterales bacterium RsTz2092]|nr:transcriptional regulator [Deferribacterales bacterium]
MKITKACDYAVRVLVIMAENPADIAFMRSDMAKISGVPDSFLGKIMQTLAKAGILSSVRGKNGGFKLGRKSDKISIYDVITSIEGDITLSDCLSDDTLCQNRDFCKIHDVWNDLQDSFIKRLKRTKISSLLKDTQTRQKK